MENQIISIPDSSEIAIGAAGAVKMAEDLVIKSNDEFIAAQELRDHCESKIRMGEMLFEEPTRTADKLHKQLVKLFKAATSPWENAARILKQKMIQWDRDQEQARRLEEARLESERNKEAAKERQTTFELLKELGLHERAEELRAEPAAFNPVVLPKSTPDVGLRYRSDWKYRVTDPQAVPREYLMLDHVAIGKVVRALKDKTNIAGIEPYETKV